MVTIKQTPLFTVIKLSTNQSASWRETKIVITIMVLLVMSIAIGWTMAGAWIILPFAGLEVGLFAYFMYRICRQGFAQQIITITAKSSIKYYIRQFFLPFTPHSVRKSSLVAFVPSSFLSPG